MYKLMVSYDCGMHYTCKGKAETPEELHSKTQEFDNQGLRWVIENENGEIEDVSLIHRNIITHIAAIRS